MEKGLKVAIVGGGMGGLCLAVALMRSGIAIDIFEQAVCPLRSFFPYYLRRSSQEKFEEIGAGIAIGKFSISKVVVSLLDEMKDQTEFKHCGNLAFWMKSFVSRTNLLRCAPSYMYPDFRTTTLYLM